MMDGTRQHRSAGGHSLLEAIIAAAVFVMVAVALSAVWVMYGRALAKSAENLAANHLARSVTEGLIANGYEWLKTREGSVHSLTYTMERQVRGNVADIVYDVNYKVAFNTGIDRADRPWPLFSQDIGGVTVSVRWNSAAPGKPSEDGLYNNAVSYQAYVYKGALH